MDEDDESIIASHLQSNGGRAEANPPHDASQNDEEAVDRMLHTEMDDLESSNPMHPITFLQEEDEEMIANSSFGLAQLNLEQQTQPKRPSLLASNIQLFRTLAQPNATPKQQQSSSDTTTLPQVEDPAFSSNTTDAPTDSSPAIATTIATSTTTANQKTIKDRGSKTPPSSSEKPLILQHMRSSWHFVVPLLVLLDACYIAISVPFRVGFWFDPIANDSAWTNELMVLSVVDLIGEAVRIGYAVQQFRIAYWGASCAEHGRHRRPKRIARTRQLLFQWLPRKIRAAPHLSVTSPRMNHQSGGGPAERTMNHSALLDSPPMKANTQAINHQAAVDEDEDGEKEVTAAELTSLKNSTASRSSKGTRASGSKAATASSTISPIPPLLMYASIVPIELIPIGLKQWNYLHIVRVYKFLFAYSLIQWGFSGAVIQPLRRHAWVRALSFSTISLPFELFWIGLLLCHLSACGYMLLAHIQCGLTFSLCSKKPVPGCWVLKDNLEYGTLWRQYIRTMYWASKTVTTLGQGDLVPTTEMETNYCIVVQFISGVWATAFLSACSLYFSRRDGNTETSVTTYLQQALRFVGLRSVQPKIALRIRSYHQYLLRTRNGIEEDQALAALPAHYQTQCSNYVKFKYIARVPFFSKQSGAFLRTILEMVEYDFLSPRQSVVRVHALEEMIIVSRGKLQLMTQPTGSASGLVLRLLEAGDIHGEDAIFEDVIATTQLVSISFSEILCLTRPNMHLAMEKHFPKLRIAMILAQVRKRMAAAQQTAPSEGVTAARTQSVIPLTAAALHRPRSTFIHALERTLGTIRGDFSTRDLLVAWRLPESKFRARWRRIKVACLLLIAMHVPFEIAFEWRQDVTDIFAHQATSAIRFTFVGLVECFFYVDWYLRAFEFVSHVGITAGSTTTRRQRWLQYFAQENVVFDIVANFPFYFVWKGALAFTLRLHVLRAIRFLRLMALLRLRVWRSSLRKLLVEYDVRPASQLMLNVVIFCVASANAMGCLFFLLTDSFSTNDDAIRGGLPLGFNRSTMAVSSSQCLEQASIYGNCTWFVHDYSTYGIESRYLRSMHWSLVLLSTVGYGDVVSISDSECFLGFWWIYLGALICYFTACTLTSVIGQLTIIKTTQAARLEEINRSLVAVNVSKRLRSTIRKFYQNNWTLNGSAMAENELINHLPRSLRLQLTDSLYLDVLRNCSIFAPCQTHAGLLREMAQAVESTLFLREMVIVEAGQSANQAFFILSGRVEVLLMEYNIGNSTAESSKTVASSSATPESTSKPPMLYQMRGIGPGTLRRSSSQSNKVVGAATQHTPVSILRKHQFFCEESLLSEERVVSRAKIRALSSTQVAVLSRDRYVAIAERFPAIADQVNALIMTKRNADAALFKTIRLNHAHYPKASEVLGQCETFLLRRPVTVHAHKVVAPGSKRYLCWHAITGIAIMYNFFQIPFRVAFLPRPREQTIVALSIVDYVLDLVLYLDIYLKWTRLGFTENGDPVLDPQAIRERYWNGWFKWDCLSMLPLYWMSKNPYVITLCRLPRLLKSPQLLEYFHEIEALIQERWLGDSSTILNAFDLVKFVLYFLSAAHQIGSVYFLIGRLQLESGAVSTSWISVDPIMALTPESTVVKYIRSVYWCLETFTVVCFGDVIARNTLETIFASATCILGWVCIGQVIGKMTSLMSNLNKDAQDHSARVEDLEQYAKKVRLPLFLRERAIESIEYKSKSLTHLRLPHVFHDLPPALRLQLFEEVHGPLVRQLPEFVATCSTPQLRAIAHALYLEIYLPDDLIIEEGRLGTKLFIMREGRAEVYTTRSKMVFAAIHEGVLFGDLAFFLKGTKQLASVRASQSCQVLQLDRSVWMALWPDRIRQSLENRLVPIIKRKYHSVSRAYINIIKNFELARSGGGMGPQNHHAKQSHEGMNGPRLFSLVEEPAPSPTMAPPSKLAGVTAKLVATVTTALVSNASASKSKIVPSSSPPKRVMGPPPTSVRPYGTQRKLSGLTGVNDYRPTKAVPAHGGHQLQQIEEEWKRHEKNLRVMKFINKQHQQTEKVLELTGAIKTTTGIGGTLGLDTSATADSSVASVVAQNHGRSTIMYGRSDPSKSLFATGGSDRNLTGTTAASVAMAQTPHEFHSTLRSDASDSLTPLPSSRSLCKNASARHSIQVNRADLTYNFEANVGDRTTSDVKSPRRTMVARKFFRPESSKRIAVINEPMPNQPSPLTTPTRLSSSRSLQRSLKHLLQTVKNATLLSPTKSSSQASSIEPDDGDDLTDAIGLGENTYTHVKHLEMLEERSRRRHRQSFFGISRGTVDVQHHLRNPYEIWIEPPLPPSFCMENSTFRRLWTVWMLLVCLYYVLIVPFRISFDFEVLQERVTKPDGVLQAWFSLEYVLDLTCILDFMLHKNYFTFIHRGELVTNRRQIRDHYLRDGTYIYDLLTIVPLEILLPIVFPSPSITWYRISVARFNKLLRIVHLHELSDKVQRLLLYDLKATWISSSIVHVLRFCFDFALGAHWVACFFYGVAFQLFDPAVPSWLSSAGMLCFDGCPTYDAIAAVPVKSKYSRSYHFSMGAITTVSYGDIAAQNAWETFAGTFVIVTSIVLFGMLSGGWFKVFEMEIGRRADYEEKIDRVAHYVAFHRFQSRMWKQIQLFFAVHWQESHGLNEEEQLRGLTTPVKNDIILYVKREFISKLRLFASCEEAFARAVVAAFHQELYVRNDIIIAEGDTGRSLYVIENGLVAVRFAKKNLVSPSGSSKARVSWKVAANAAATSVAEGEVIKTRFDFIGEKSLLFGMPRSATCIALSSCSMLILTVEKYHAILEEFPEYRERNMRDWIFTAVK